MPHQDRHAFSLGASAHLYWDTIARALDPSLCRCCGACVNVVDVLKLPARHPGAHTQYRSTKADNRNFFTLNTVLLLPFHDWAVLSACQWFIFGVVHTDLGTEMISKYNQIAT